MNQTNNFETPMQLQQLWTITYNEHHFKLWINETATLNSNESNKLYWNTNELVTSINKIMTSNSQWIMPIQLLWKQNETANLTLQ